MTNLVEHLGGLSCQIGDRGPERLHGRVDADPQDLASKPDLASAHQQTGLRAPRRGSQNDHIEIEPLLAEFVHCGDVARDPRWT